ncbi:NAD(P)-binding domain-containing protein [Spirillospora sp. NPDC029432]|uniref:NAD(P)-binding domain-containing protein n=1 Tax=Spirillospora sp. NPDC029432 TaxID=3154599 RepID=UPI003455E579
MTDKTPVTILGLGAMGAALAAALIEAGHPTTVWNRSPEKAGPLVERGATRAATVADAAAASPLVIACLLDHEVVDALLGPAADALSGRDLVNLTNGTPEHARTAAAWADRHGIAYVDGGIMATPPLIGGPDAFILYSGSQAAFDRHRETLGELGGARFLGEEPGMAALYDLALLSAMYGMAAGVRHAQAMVGDERAEAFSAEYLTPWLQAMAGPIAAGAAGEESDSPLGMQAVGLANIVAGARGAGTPLDLLTHMLTPMRDIVAAGYDDLLPPLIDEIATA